MYDEKGFENILKYFDAANKPACVKNFLKKVGDKDFWEKEFKRRKLKLDYDHFYAFCYIFCIGITYVYNTCSTAPKEIKIYNKRPDRGHYMTGMFYDNETKMVYISYDTFLRNQNWWSYFYYPVLDKFMCKFQYAFRAGIEEAYHHFQNTNKKQFYKKWRKLYNYESPTVHYDNPIELDAQKFQLKALKKMEFNYFPYNNEREIDVFYRSLTRNHKKYFLRNCKFHLEAIVEEKVPKKLNLSKHIQKQIKKL